jgi:hypothetical protein
MYKYICIYIYIHTYMCIYMHIYMYTYTYMYVYIYLSVLDEIRGANKAAPSSEDDTRHIVSEASSWHLDDYNDENGDENDDEDDYIWCLLKITTLKRVS